MLVLDAVSFAYQGQQQPYRFDLEARPGQVTAISGPSGSGKSTLLDLIAGFIQPDSGSIKLDGRDLVSLPPEERPVSLLFQSESLFEHLSTGRNVALGLPENSQKSATAKISAALAEVGLSGIENQRAATLSGGQKQRVALARTLLRARPVLLLDEPFSALDDQSRRTTRDLVRALTEHHNWTTILVSHHQDDIAALAAREYRIVEKRLAVTA